jgi:hypothetical protein
MRVEINGRPVVLGSLMDQIYSLEDEAGVQYHWNVSEGMRHAQRRGGLGVFLPLEAGVTVEQIRLAYLGMDESYALTTDVNRPLLFLTLHGKTQLADGWHRLFKAVVTGVECLPCYVLTEAETESILWLKLPPGQGLDWGQHAREGGVQ